MVVFHPPWPYGHDLVLAQRGLQARDDTPEPIEVEDPPEDEDSLAEFPRGPRDIEHKVDAIRGRGLGECDGGAGEGGQREETRAKAQGDVAGGGKRRRDGYTSRIPARRPRRIRGARDEAGQTDPQATGRRGNAARDQVCVVGPPPQDRADNLVELTADREPCGGARGGIALENPPAGVVPDSEEALRTKAVEEAVRAIERVLNGVASALKEPVLVLA